MTDQFTANDPLSLLRTMWGNIGNMSGMGGGMGLNMPGMMTPTFDVDELEKRINDLKAVEGWLRMNLSMLQMSIQGMEMQKATLTVVQAMSEAATKAGEAVAEHAQAPSPTQSPAEAEAPEGNAGGAVWPWTLMQQVQEAMQAVPTTEPEPAPKRRSPRKAKTAK